MTKKELREKIRSYKEFKADIVDIDIRLEELKEEDGLSGMGYEERTGKTYKISQPTEIQGNKNIKKETELKEDRRRLEREIKKIDNALTVLEEEEKIIVETILLNNRPYYKAQDKLRLSYPRVKQIESDALSKMEKYIL